MAMHVNITETRKNHGVTNPKDEKGFCVIPFTQSFIQDNRSRLCCESKQTDVFYLTEDVNFSDIWNNDFHQSIRKQMLSGSGVLPTCCEICTMDEESGEESMRQFQNKYQNASIADFNSVIAPPPISYDIRANNKCNLECVMCDGRLSTAIHKRLNDYGLTDDDDFPVTFGEEWKQQAYIIDHVKENSSNITSMRFAGGEPFLMPEVLDMLEYFANTGDSKNIDLQILTNGTTVRTKWFSNILTKYKKVRLKISIDGIGETGEYVRYPSKWSVVDKNIQRLLKISKENDNINVDLVPVIHLLNALEMDKVIEYAAINEVDMALTPVYTASSNYHITADLLTNDLRKIAHDKMMNMLDKYPDMSFSVGKGFITNLLNMKQRTDPRPIQQLNQVVKYWDSHREVKFLDRYPYLDYLIK